MRSLVLVALVLMSCGSLASPRPSPSKPTTSVAPTATAIATAQVPGRSLPAAEAQRLVSAKVLATLDALKKKDGTALAAVAHPTKGVRFTPYPFVQLAKDVVLMRADLAKAYSDATKRTWGITDGKGDPITLTFADYNTRYVWSRDFLVAPKTAYNKPIGTGNSTDNTADVYPNAILFEAYDPGPVPAEESVRWQSLRLLFEPVGADWYLVGVVHGEWTI